MVWKLFARRSPQVLDLSGELLSRLLDRHAAAKLCQYLQPVIAAAPPVRRSKLQRRPHFAYIDLSRRILKSGRHHADDRRRASRSAWFPGRPRPAILRTRAATARRR